MIPNCSKANKKLLGADTTVVDQLINQPQESVTFDSLLVRFVPEPSITGQQRPAIDLRQRQSKAVWKRQTSIRLANPLCERDTRAIELCDLQAKFHEVRSPMFQQLAAIKHIRHCKSKGQAEACPQQATSFKVDDDRRIGDEDVH